MEDLLKKDGYVYSCKIEKDPVIGIITVESGIVFFCQNSKKGKECSDKKNFKYSWSISSGKVDDLKSNSVTDFKLYEKMPVVWDTKYNRKFVKFIEFSKNEYFIFSNFLDGDNGISDFQRIVIRIVKETYDLPFSYFTCMKPTGKNEVDTITAYNYTFKHGQSVRAVIDGNKIEGKITIENKEVFICQNYVEGTYCHNKQGYDCSWIIYPNASYYDQVKNLEIIENSFESIKKPKNYYIHETEQTLKDIIAKIDTEETIDAYGKIFKNGQRFTAIIDGIETEGKITIQDKSIYLCQNDVKGDKCIDKQGYKFSWIIYPNESFLEEIRDLQLINEDSDVLGKSFIDSDETKDFYIPSIKDIITKKTHSYNNLLKRESKLKYIKR